MKNLKKVLALVVVFTMMLSTVAFAAYPDVAADADYATAVEVLSALKILQGDDQGNFNPDANITRAEFAAVVCRALGLEDSANGAKGATAFEDVAASHWATGYINLANQMGIINGMGDGTFAPEANVTYEQAVKMLTCALGYEYMAQTKGGWPTGYLVVANTYGVTAGVKATAGEPAARSVVAELTYNALDCPIMEQGTYGTEEYWYVYDGITHTPKKTLLSEKLDVAKLTGVVVANNRVGIATNAAEEGKFTFTVKEDVETKFVQDYVKNGTYASLNVADSKADTFLGNKVDLYITEVSRNEWDALVLVPEDGKNVVTTFATSDLDTVKTTGATIYYEEEGKTVSTKLEIDNIVSGTGATPTEVVINNVWQNGAGYFDAPTNSLANDASGLADALAANLVNGRVKAIDWENDFTYDVVFVDTYKHAIVDRVNATSGMIRTKNYGNIDVKLNDDNYIVTIKDVEGNDVALEDIAEDDILAIITDNPAANPGSFTKVLDITVLPAAEYTVTGTVTEIDAPASQSSVNTTHKVYVDGEAYGLSAIDAATSKILDYTDIAANSVGTFYLTVDGKIVGFNGDKAADGSYAFILQSGITTGGIGDGELQMKVLTAEGEIVTYSVASNVEIPVVGAPNKTYDTSATGYSVTGGVNNVTAANFTGSAWNSALITAAANKITTETAGTTSIRELLANFSLPTGTADYASRLVKLNVTAAGKINRIEVPGIAINATSNTFSVDPISTKTEYKADSTQWDSYILADNAVVFVIDPGNDYTDSTVKTVSEAFIDENKYAGYVYDAENGYNAAAMITEKDSKLGGANGFAVVTTVTNITTENNEKALKVRVLQNGSSDEEAITIVSGKTYEITGMTAPTSPISSLPTIASGDIIEYASDANGIVDTYAKVATRSGATYTPNASFTWNVANTASGNAAFMKDTVYAYGYITDITGGNIVKLTGLKSDTSGSTAITNAAYFINDDANQYYFKHIGTNKYDLKADAWWMGKVDSYEDVDSSDSANTGDKVTYALVKVYDGKVVDIIALDTENRVVLP